MRLLLCLLLLAPSAALAGETCTSVVGLARHRAANQQRRARSLERVEADAVGARVVYTAANLAAPRGFRPAGVRLLDANPERLRVALSPELARACGADELELFVDDSVGRGRQIVHLDDAGALLLEDGQLFWWGEDPPRFQMVWRSSFAVDVAAAAPVVRLGKARRRR